jgi:hypothetical protein
MKGWTRGKGNTRPKNEKNEQPNQRIFVNISIIVSIESPIRQPSIVLSPMRVKYHFSLIHIIVLPMKAKISPIVKIIKKIAINILITSFLFSISIIP